LAGAVHADYSVDVRDLRGHLKTLLESSPLWDRQAWNLQVTQLDEKAVQMRALFSARDSGSRWDLSFYVREGMLAYLRNRAPSDLPRVRVEIAPQPLPCRIRDGRMRASLARESSGGTDMRVIL